ncbi:MAG: hypothetical protein HYY02_06210 [Chloroflexi bacterium]|nr:hypothetical protein [Chloroflexota bacterium]
MAEHQSLSQPQQQAAPSSPPDAAARHRRAAAQLGPQLATLEPAAQGALLSSLAGLEEVSARALEEFLAAAATALSALTSEQGGALLALAGGVAARSPIAAQELLRAAPGLLQRLSLEELERWCRRGEDLLRSHEAAGVSYFRLQSRHAQESLAQLSSLVTLGEVREVLRLYCQALMGQNVSILATEELRQESGGWITGEEINWEGAAIFVPSVVEEYATKEDNFAAYKVLATHQSAHLEFGTYDFAFEEGGALFRPLRLRLGGVVAPERPYLASYERYFALYADRRLSRDLFTLAEDERIDARVHQEYRGIRRAYRRVQEYALEQRPPLLELPLREYLVELLVTYRLRPPGPVAVPRKYASLLTAAAGIVRLVGGDGACAADVAEAALRLYILLRQTPNLPLEAIPSEGWTQVDLAQAQYDPATEDLDRLARAFRRVNRLPRHAESDAAAPEDQDLPYNSPPPVHHRNDVRPEVMQALLHFQREQDRKAGEETQDITLEELLQRLAERSEYMDAWGTMSESESLDAHLLLGQYLRTMNENEALRQSISPLVESLAEREVQVYIYDEWDYRTKSYRPGWCRLHQRTLKEGSEEFYDETLRKYPALVHAVRKQFEMLRPEAMGRVKRLLDGEEFDLDAVVDSVVNKRSGDGLRDKVYWRRRKTERSVAVALLLDMSLSTDERVDQALPRNFASLGPDDALVAQRNGTSAGKRIIEIEKEGLVLLMEAMEQIGDVYGIYGFSGSGRSDVQLFSVKDLREPFSSRVKARVDKIMPLQGTRMGTAIRHTITRLAQEEARTKLLVLLSDGRPQDRDYGTLPWELEGPHRGRYRPLEQILDMLGPDGVMTDEKEYAVHDTKAALSEAKLKSITPFCISIDKNGHDYLKAMCGDIGYEVVADIYSLPRRLPALYRRLTT